MDSLSTQHTRLGDTYEDAIELDSVDALLSDYVDYGYSLARARSRVGMDPPALAAAAPGPAATSTVLALPAVLPPALRQRFENLSRLEQAAVLALGAALLVAGVGWALGAAKAASLGAAAAAL
jgi:hypothetical protein